MVDNLVPSIVDLPQVFDSSGTIGIIEGAELLPFQVNRVYFIYGVSEGAVRGSHAHKQLQQLIFAASGSFDLVLDDGETVHTFNLNSPKTAVLVPTGYWRTLQNFSTNAVCIVLASTSYDESDYIRDYAEFLEWRQAK
jgi:dTDP-4-dehydrorhamnose 3,5-epimerase-like enzyme